MCHTYMHKKKKAGWTPLMIAVSTGHTDVVELLLKNKADPNLENDSGQYALYVVGIHDVV